MIEIDIQQAPLNQAWVQLFAATGRLGACYRLDVPIWFLT